ncbi:hypothetical protein NTJ12_002313 [Flavobacterium psychrophilum]|nr:hypothetical protein [Flavobacterium psychrophilum]
MIKKIIISFFLTFVILSCKKNNDANISTEVIRTDSINNAGIKKNINSKDENYAQGHESFTLDCGSGCAMTYDEVLKKNNHNSVEIKYKVTQYINEKIEDEYFETYIFESDENGSLSSIHLDNSKENILNDDSSLLRDQFLEIGGEFFDKKISNQSNSKDVELVTGNKPYNLMVVPFDLRDYVNNLPNEMKNSYFPTEKTKKYLISVGYEGETYKCFFLKIDNKSTELIISITRGDSEYFLLIKSADNKFSSYKEIGSIGGEETKYFKIDKNYNVVSY